MPELGFLYSPKAMDVGMQIVHSLPCQYLCNDDTILRKNPTHALVNILLTKYNSTP